MFYIWYLPGTWTNYSWTEKYQSMTKERVILWKFFGNTDSK